MAANAHRYLIAPTTEEQTVAPDMARRRPNAALRSREHLTPDEVERLIGAAKQGRWGHRDATIILVAYRHGLRASELTDLRWIRSTFRRPTFPSGAPRRAPLQPTRSWAMSCGLFAGCSGSKSLSHPLSSPASAEVHSPPLASRASLRPPPGELVWRSRPTLTCCATPAVTSSPMMGTTRVRCRPISAIKIFSIRCAIPNCRQCGSKVFGVDTASALGGAPEKTRRNFCIMAFSSRTSHRHHHFRVPHNAQHGD